MMLGRYKVNAANLKHVSDSLQNDNFACQLDNKQLAAMATNLD